jgi:predicted AlkP superfamily phosphohydrolase/phosphomutase
VNTPKIVILGLDSATWDLARPWAARGLLPNLSRLIAQGVSGDLESATPPLTPPAWTTFMTGKNPGKHGIFNFLEPQQGSYAMRYANAGSRRSSSIWKLLSQAGFTVGSVNVPFTFPPERDTTFQISGMDTPSRKSPFIHPPELRVELERELGEIDLEIRYLGFMSTDERRDKVLRDMARVDDQWLRIGLYLLEHHPVDVMMVTFMSIDTVQHHFWHYMDPSHFLHDTTKAERYGDAILQVYQRLDRAVGKFLERLPEETTVIVLSDHGGGPVSDRVVYLNRHLAQLGLLKYRQSATSAVGSVQQRILRTAFSKIRGFLSSDQKRTLASLFPALRERFEGAASSFANIDWSGTKAYCSEVLAAPPSIWINLKGIRPEGVVEPSEYESLRDYITAKFAELKDPRDGSPVIPRIYKREELFRGPHAEEAADLILDWWSEKAFQTGVSHPEEIDQPVVQIRERAPMKEPEWGGTHRLNGILIIKGPALKNGAQVKGARLLDMAPTILHLLNQKVPESMDGRVLTDALQPEFVRERAVQFVGASDDGANGSAPAQGSPYSEEDAALIEERLKALGYVD